MLTFTNNANRCWFIAAIQAVLHIPQIANLLRDDILDKIIVKKRKNSSDFVLELSRIAREYWATFSHEKVENIDALYDIFVKINRNFGGKKMYDATEAFLAIVETIDNALMAKRAQHLAATCNEEEWNTHIEKTKSSFMSDLLTGQAKRIYKGEETYEHFSGITIMKNSIEAGIGEFLNDKDTGITRTLTHLPLILPIIFQKNADKQFVHYDITMNVGSVEYTLFSVLLHSNSHWVTMCFNAGIWYLLDDSKYTRIFDLNTIIQKDAMLVLYKRKSSST